MAQTVQLKRSAVPGKVPTTSDIALGEIAVNTYDGKVFIKKDNGTASIVEIGAGSVATSRVVSYADATSITINADTTDIATMVNTQAAGTFTINSPTGSFYDGQKLMFRLKSTNIQTFSWNAIYAGSVDAPLPTASSGSSLTDYVGFIYDSTSTKWHVIAKNFGY